MVAFTMLIGNLTQLSPSLYLRTSSSRVTPSACQGRYSVALPTLSQVSVVTASP